MTDESAERARPAYRGTIKLSSGVRMEADIDGEAPAMIRFDRTMGAPVAIAVTPADIDEMTRVLLHAQSVAYRIQRGS